MICVYCLRRAAVVSRRCQSCQDYLDRLHSSDDDADRAYSAVIQLQAARYYTDRQRGGERRAA